MDDEVERTVSNSSRNSIPPTPSLNCIGRVRFGTVYQTAPPSRQDQNHDSGLVYDTVPKRRFLVIECLSLNILPAVGRSGWQWQARQTDGRTDEAEAQNMQHCCSLEESEDVMVERSKALTHVTSLQKRLNVSVQI